MRTVDGETVIERPTHMSEYSDHNERSGRPLSGGRVATPMGFVASLATLVCCVAIGQDSVVSADGTVERCKKFCVSVEPKNGDTETVFTFSGRGWRPKRKVEAQYSVYCRIQQEPKVVCKPVGLVKRLRADKRGHFVFRFRNGPGKLDPNDIPPPSAQGGGPVRFSQWRGRPYHSKRIRRKPLYCVDGELPGFYSKPCPPTLPRR
jgi:hypothetical protein